MTLDKVVAAAFEVLDRVGASRLSTREIAAELGVSMNTVMWHIRSKDRLLELMADAIVGEVPLTDLPDDWCARASELLQRLRGALLSHRDGAAIVAGTFSAEPNTLAFADGLVDALIEGCPTRRSAAWTMWSLFYFTLGLVQEEQSAATWHDRVADDLDSELYPGLASVWDEFRVIDFGERFDYGIAQILRSGA